MSTALLPEKPVCAGDTDFLACYQATERQSPEALLQTLRSLLMHYAHNRSPLVAGNIANCLSTLLMHPHFKAPASERCTYRQMQAYWRLLETLG